MSETCDHCGHTEYTPAEQTKNLEAAVRRAFDSHTLHIPGIGKGSE